MSKFNKNSKWIMVLVSWISKKQNMKENRFDVCKGRPDFLNHLYILNRPFFNTKNWLFSLMLKVIKMFGFFKINNVTLVAFGLSAISFGKHCLILTWNIDRVINVKSFENSYPCHEYNFKVTPSKAKLHLMASKNSSIKKYVKSNQSIEKQPHIIVALIKHRNQPHFYSLFGFLIYLWCVCFGSDDLRYWCPWWWWRASPTCSPTTSSRPSSSARPVFADAGGTCSCKQTFSGRKTFLKLFFVIEIEEQLMVNSI